MTSESCSLVENYELALFQSRLLGSAFQRFFDTVLCFLQQTCYNRCISKDSQLVTVTTTVLTSDIHPSLSTVTMSANSSDLAFEEYTKSSGVSFASTSNARLASSLASALPDTKSCREPVSYVSAFTLSVLWHVVYWTSQALTWFARLMFLAVIETFTAQKYLTFSYSLKGCCIRFDMICVS